MNRDLEREHSNETEFASIARGFGGDGVIVRRPENLAPLKAWIAARARGVLVVDARVDSDFKADWYAEAFEATKQL